MGIRLAQAHTTRDRPPQPDLHRLTTLAVVPPSIDVWDYRRTVTAASSRSRSHPDDVSPPAG
jgi:hypothetical protein